MTFNNRLITRASWRWYLASLLLLLTLTTVKSQPESDSQEKSPTTTAHKKPKTGEQAPEFSAAQWLNLADAPTLASMQGKVVLLEFWAPWCSHCVSGIPNLNELKKKYQDKNFQILSFVSEDQGNIEKFLKKHAVDFPIGLESSAFEEYGVSTIPHAFLIDATGKVRWQGLTNAKKLDKEIAELLKTPSTP